MSITNENYYETLTPEQKQEWDAEQEYSWKVKLPEGLRQDKRKAEADWKHRKEVWSWIGAEDWQFGFLGWEFLNHPERACRRIVRLSLPEGGQLRVIETFRLYHDERVFPHHEACEGEKCMCSVWPTYPICDFHTYPERVIHAYLVATVEVDGSLRRFRGTLQDTYPGEMSASAVVFSSSTPQIIADRCAKILDLTMMQGDGKNFFALLDGVDRCAICRHPLRDPISKLVAVGPDCAEKFGVPHTLEAAQKRLELRKKLLSITS
jgi:hypothetical protein